MTLKRGSKWIVVIQEGSVNLDQVYDFENPNY